MSNKPESAKTARSKSSARYQLPPLELLQRGHKIYRTAELRKQLKDNARLIKKTLAQFGIKVSAGYTHGGPTFIRYELHPAPGVPLEQISALSSNLAAVLKSPSINIHTPIPGKNAVGIDVPASVRKQVFLRDVLESSGWRNPRTTIPIALGMDVYGRAIIADLAEMPHLLIAGSTGSGKSACIDAIIASLLYKFSPERIRFVMICPRAVGLQFYGNLPHLAIPMATDVPLGLSALRWVVAEMEKRYQLFAHVGTRNLKFFNQRAKPRNQRPAEADIPKRLPRIIVIIDELADLMMVSPTEVEKAISAITQLGVTVGIHCIIATERPSVDIITGNIKSNISSRIAFQVTTAADSRTILESKGADKLLGKGDMYYQQQSEYPGSVRAQCALITEQEIQSLVRFITAQKGFRGDGQNS